MISIVTAYHNRLQLFINTLKSIESSEIKDFEVIAVDDGSSDEHRLERLLPRFPYLKIIRIEPEDKWWVNPCVPYNLGFKEAKGDIIIIQNPECRHMGDILKKTSNLKTDEYISFACYSLDKDSTYSPIKNLKIIDRPISYDGQLGWYNHSKYRAFGYHFCSAIHKNNLDLLGGFDERYAKGIGYDDNEILVRIRRMGLNINIVDSPFVSHQWHYENGIPFQGNSTLRNINSELLTNTTMKELTWKVN